MSHVTLSDGIGLMPLSRDYRDLAVAVGISAAGLVFSLAALWGVSADALFQMMAMFA